MRRRFAFIFFMLFYLHSNLAYAQLKFYIVSSPPYAWVNDKGESVGIYADIARALANYAAIPFELEVNPFIRAAQTEAGDPSGVTFLFSNAASMDKVDHAAIVFYTNQVVQIQSNKSIRNRNELVTLQIGRLRNGCMELAGDSSVAWNFYEITSQEQGVKMLAHQRLDAFCSAGEAIDFASRNAGLEQKIATTQRFVLASRPVWMMLPKSLKPTQRQALINGLSQLQKSGELMRIFKHYLGDSYVLKLSDGNQKLVIEPR